MKRYKRKKTLNRKKRRVLLKNILIFFLFFFFSFALIYFFVFSSVFFIKEIKILGNEKISKEEIMPLINAQIDKKIFSIPSKSIFIVNSAEIRRELMERFPNIYNVEVKKRISLALEVKIKERLPNIPWCQNEICFYIDEEGIILGEIVKNENTFLSLDLQRDKIFLGEKIIDKKSISFVNEIKKELKNGINYFLLLEDEKRINVFMEEDWVAYFSLEENILRQAENLKIVLAEKIPEEKRKDLEYVDLRFKNRAYFKYKD